MFNTSLDISTLTKRCLILQLTSVFLNFIMLNVLVDISLLLYYDVQFIIDVNLLFKM